MNQVWETASALPAYLCGRPYERCQEQLRVSFSVNSNIPGYEAFYFPAHFFVFPETKFLKFFPEIRFYVDCGSRFWDTCYGQDTTPILLLLLLCYVIMLYYYYYYYGYPPHGEWKQRGHSRPSDNSSVVPFE